MMFSRSAASMIVRKLTIALMACVAVFSVFFFEADHAHAAFGPSTMYTPPSGSPSPGALYGRALRLQHSGSANGTMLTTFEQYVNGTPSFPIFRSTRCRQNMDADFQCDRPGERLWDALGAPIVRASAGNRQYAGRYDSLRRECQSLPTCPRRNSISIRVRITARRGRSSARLLLAASDIDKRSHADLGTVPAGGEQQADRLLFRSTRSKLWPKDRASNIDGRRKLGLRRQ